ncbi:MAG: dynamin family protein [Mollicutes bacterium]|nr:dynamin family protein [Mollicutes bacterium]
MNEALLEKFNKVDALVQKINNEKLINLSKFLKERLMNPDSYIIMLGETSSGKSTIINGLIQQNILKVSAAPSTGAITEIEFKKDIDENKFYAINKNATIEELDYETFKDLTLNPDEELKRVKLITKTSISNLNNMRLFDTPGYGSIIKEHEEVLKEFIPNSDIILYIVNYRIGIQENDYSFLGFLKQLIREDVEIILVINRCPENLNVKDRRIKEIKQYVNDILNEDVKTFFIKTEQCENEDEYPMPKAIKLWQYVGERVNSDTRKKQLESTFNEYINELFEKCKEEVFKRYEGIKLSRETQEKIKKHTEEFGDKIDECISKYITPGFDKIQKKVPELMLNAKKNIKDTIDKAIDEESASQKDEMIAYINNHLLYYISNKEILEIQRYIEIELDYIDKQVDDYLNTEIENFNKKITVCFETATELAIKGISKDIGKNLVKGGLIKYFTQFGGNGKVGAGIANAASHALKVVGDAFGHTFKRETHNALKHILSKIGATSVRALSTATVVFTELISTAIDYSIWKGKLKQKLDDVLNDWHTETEKSIKNDLEILKEENIKTLKEIKQSCKERYEYNESFNKEEEVLELMDMINEIKEEVGE